jgi:hypothetical protein
MAGSPPKVETMLICSPLCNGRDCTLGWCTKRQSWSALQCIQQCLSQGQVVPLGHRIGLRRPPPCWSRTTKEGIPIAGFHPAKEGINLADLQPANEGILIAGLQPTNEGIHPSHPLSAQAEGDIRRWVVTSTPLRHNNSCWHMESEWQVRLGSVHPTPAQQQLLARGVGMVSSSGLRPPNSGTTIVVGTWSQSGKPPQNLTSLLPCNEGGPGLAIAEQARHGAQHSSLCCQFAKQ